MDPVGHIVGVDAGQAGRSALKAEPALAAGLQALLPEPSGSGPTLHQDIGGDDNKAAQVHGTGNDVRINRVRVPGCLDTGYPRR